MESSSGSLSIGSFSSGKILSCFPLDKTIFIVAEIRLCLPKRKFF